MLSFKLFSLALALLCAMNQLVAMEAATTSFTTTEPKTDNSTFGCLQLSATDNLIPFAYEALPEDMQNIIFTFFLKEELNSQKSFLTLLKRMHELIRINRTFSKEIERFPFGKMNCSLLRFINKQLIVNAKKTVHEDPILLKKLMIDGMTTLINKMVHQKAILTCEKRFSALFNEIPDETSKEKVESQSKQTSVPYRLTYDDKIGFKLEVGTKVLEILPNGEMYVRSGKQWDTIIGATSTQLPFTECYRFTKFLKNFPHLSSMHRFVLMDSLDFYNENIKKIIECGDAQKLKKFIESLNVNIERMNEYSTQLILSIVLCYALVLENNESALFCINQINQPELLLTPLHIALIQDKFEIAGTLADKLTYTQFTSELNSIFEYFLPGCTFEEVQFSSLSDQDAHDARITYARKVYKIVTLFTKYFADEKTKNYWLIRFNVRLTKEIADHMSE